MGEDVPLDLARRGRGRRAGAVARGAADPRVRRAAAHPAGLGDPDRRRAGRDPHRAERDQAGLPVPGAARSRAAARPGQGHDRGADRRAVHRAQPPDGGAAQGQDLPRRPATRRRRSPCCRQHRRVRRPAADLAPRQGARRPRAGSASAPRRPCTSGASRRSTAQQQIMRLTDITLDVRVGGGVRRCSAPPRARRSPICRRRWPTTPWSISSRSPPTRSKSIEAAIADFQTPADGVEAEAAVTGLRLVGIEFDSRRCA